MSRNKRLINSIDEDMYLAGLVIDWHLADTDQVAETLTEMFSVPSLAYQPTYAYAQVTELSNTRSKNKLDKLSLARMEVRD